MADDLIPTLSEFRKAWQAALGRDHKGDYDALTKLMRYAAIAAGYSLDEIRPQPPKPKPVQPEGPSAKSRREAMERRLGL
ncbi:hypothetical protein GOFOIKOB_3993 [Methylobacterium tardum]|uniref:Uncharacterized protein n=1 Tax=Methylobacterium tardum TaxID=374432 RepID=A0AA37WR34_9HYPH|nr:hypothetical protein [Methylobacterium tardum]URD38156.1 hypothetical protein M6G65_06745 [Methylobacterium tardum]GJE50939.1 hypothetical protein GOFOIKOB_3993 [Methylobacterium tardum]GLS69941.1 hypothetical protein GCM10007890_19540 [Methylobacterium tardum]